MLNYQRVIKPLTNRETFAKLLGIHPFQVTLKGPTEECQFSLAEIPATQLETQLPSGNLT